MKNAVMRRVHPLNEYFDRIISTVIAWLWLVVFFAFIFCLIIQFLLFFRTLTQLLSQPLIISLAPPPHFDIRFWQKNFHLGQVIQGKTGKGAFFEILLVKLDFHFFIIDIFIHIVGKRFSCNPVTSKSEKFLTKQTWKVILLQSGDP